MYIQDENFNRRTWTEVELAENGPPETTRISKFEAKRRATVLYISITLYYAIASKENMVWCWKGVWVNGIPRNSEDPRVWKDLKDHFSSNRQPRCEQIYINCGLLLKDNLRTLLSRRYASTKTSIVESHAHSRRLYWVVRIAAGMENKKMTHQRSWIKLHNVTRVVYSSDEPT